MRVYACIKVSIYVHTSQVCTYSNTDIKIYMNTSKLIKTFAQK